MAGRAQGEQALGLMPARRAVVDDAAGHAARLAGFAVAGEHGLSVATEAAARVPRLVQAAAAQAGLPGGGYTAWAEKDHLRIAAAARPGPNPPVTVA